MVALTTGGRDKDLGIRTTREAVALIAVMAEQLPPERQGSFMMNVVLNLVSAVAVANTGLDGDEGMELKRVLERRIIEVIKEVTGK